jgi:Ankyrin repeats (3 copies)
MVRTGRPPKIYPLKLIHRAAMDNDVSGFTVELAKGTDIDAPGPMTPLHIAADRGNIEFAIALLDAGVEPINVWGNTPLWFAMKRKRTCPDGSTARLLLDRGADPRRTAQEGGKNSPLEMVRRIASVPEDLIELVERRAEQ